MTEPFLTIAQAVIMTGKSRRTMQRLVESLVKKQPDQVMKEKTDRGYIWKISQQSVQQAYGVANSPANVVSPISPHQASALSMPNIQPEKYLEVISQGHAGMMAMHQEVKQVYENQIQEKDRQIGELKQALVQARKGFLGWLFGRGSQQSPDRKRDAPETPPFAS